MSTPEPRPGDRTTGPTGTTVDLPTHEHRDVTGGWLRPAVFGAMDGLVSNFALIAGVVGGGAPAKTVALAGLAGLAAGSFSMAAGEYTSVASQSELAMAEIELERRELHEHPEAEQEELAQMYAARGVSLALAREFAAEISADPERALEAHVKEELGVHPDDLPSPRLAAISSFVSFAIGALLPVLPYLFGTESLLPALVVAMFGLFASGALVTLVTARRWWYSGLRQLVLGGGAAALTYGFGMAVGSGLS